MRKKSLKISSIALLAAVLFATGSFGASATTLEPVTSEDNNSGTSTEITVGTDEDGNVTVTYGKWTFIRKYNGWYIPATYIYDGSKLAEFLDSVIANTRRTSVRCDGFLFIKMSGGWYRHELHINDGRSLATKFNEAAGITSTYNPNGNINSEKAGVD